MDGNEFETTNAEVIACRAGAVAVFHTVKHLRGYIAAINAENPGAVEQCDSEGRAL